MLPKLRHYRFKEREVPDRFPLSALTPFLRRKYGWLTKGGLAPKISITDEDLTARVKGRTANRDFF